MHAIGEFLQRHARHHYVANDPKWLSLLTRISVAAFLFLAITGLAVTFAPFHLAVEWGLLLHTLVGVLTLVPVAWYCWAHWRAYRTFAFSHIVPLGYIGVAALVLCLISGFVVTCQALFGIKTSRLWRDIHLVTTFVALGTLLPHDRWLCDGEFRSSLCRVFAFSACVRITENSRPA